MLRIELSLILTIVVACVGTPAPSNAQGTVASAAVIPPGEQLKLIATLQSAEASRYDKVQACYRLAVIGTGESIPALVALLSDDELAHMARYAMQSMPDPSVDEALRTALGQLRGQLQVGVINSIGMRRDAKSVEALISMQNDPDLSVASAATAALGRIGNLDCAKALQSSLAQAPPVMRQAVANACLECAERLIEQNQLEEAETQYDILLKTELPASLRMAAMRGAILMRGTSGVPLLIQQINHSDPDMVAIGLSLARELPGIEVTKALAAELGMLPEEKQVLLLVALGDREDQTAVPAVLAFAENGFSETRVAALQVLAKLGNVSTVPLLLVWACDPDPEVAEAARATLAALSGEMVDTALAASVGSGTKELRLAAIEILAERRAGLAVSALAQAVADPDAGIRVAALLALGRTVGLANLGLLAEALVQTTAPEEISAANAALEEAVTRIPEKSAIAERLLAVLPQAGPEARGLLMLRLGQVGGGDSLQAVCTGVRDGDQTVRAKAVRALADWPDAAAVPELVVIVRETPDQRLRAVAFRGYVRLVRESSRPADEKVRLLEPAVALAANAQDRMVVLSALGETYDVGSLRLLTSFLGDSELVDEVGAAAVKLSDKLGVNHKDEFSPVLLQVLKSAKSKPVLDATREQMSKLGIPAG